MFTKNVYCDVIDNTISGGRVVRFEYEGEEIYDVIDRVGISPLPPYIKRESEPKDKIRYQTVFASERGAVAAPTAGLHFTAGLINRIHEKGAKTAFTTLHIGLGTFRPVQVEDLNRHQMDSEYFEVNPKTALAINETKKKRGRSLPVLIPSIIVFRVTLPSPMVSHMPRISVSDLNEAPVSGDGNFRS